MVLAIAKEGVPRDDRASTPEAGPKQVGKNIDPGPKSHRFKPRLRPPLRMKSARNRTARRDEKGVRGEKNLVTLLDLCVSSLRRGHANLLCIVPILTDDPRRESRNDAGAILFPPLQVYALSDVGIARAVHI